MNNAKVESGMLDSEYEPLVATPGAGFDVQTGGKWHKSFLACGGDIGLCCAGAWCPCLVFGQTSQMLQEEGGGGGPLWRNCCLFFAIPLAINYTTALGIMLAMGAGAIPIPVSAAALRGIDCARLILVHAGLATYAYRRRGQLRQLEAIPGEAWRDWWAFCCCPGLTVCQEAAQLRRLRETRLQAAADGYHAVVQAPQPQHMA
ncbi:hypothetical protein COHA_001293 [Chlorella ohadii]|uniref:Uncharacterized protein n=1 Tax=Chlorella ohadii TaxID=2649997 RepID=A0AAD5DZI8_9CHLO|nr:hypothetical protein COHA_001293 [Chlorella ohadii]